MAKIEKKNFPGLGTSRGPISISSELRTEFVNFSRFYNFLGWFFKILGSFFWVFHQKSGFRRFSQIFADSRFLGFLGVSECAWWICLVWYIQNGHSRHMQACLGDFVWFWARFSTFSSKIRVFRGPLGDFVVFVNFTLFPFFGDFLWADWADFGVKKSGKLFYIIYFLDFSLFWCFEVEKRDFTSKNWNCVLPLGFSPILWIFADSRFLRFLGVFEYVR